MSADSPNHSRPELAAAMQNVVTPQPVTDPTILDSVAGFINDVVPTTSGDSFDSKDQIQWVKFENLDFDEANFSSNNDTPLPSSLIIVLGYSTGVQVWAVPANGEAVELFSWRHGTVKVLRILPAPYDVAYLNKRDLFESKRPLIALVDLALHGSSSTSLNFYSLKTGEQVKQIKFKSQILDVVANRRSIAITFGEKIAVFDAFTLDDKLSITTCYLSPGVQSNPIAFGPRWLAFAEKKLIASRRSSGGNEGEGVQSYTATVLHAAKSLGRGLRELGDAVASSLTGNQAGKLGTSPNSPQAGGVSDVPQKGIVTILDVENPTTQNADGSLHPEAIVAHFVAHTEAIVWLQFGPCGMLLLTADKRGHDFNLFRINPHPLGSSLAAVHHLYTLHRGDTSAKVQDMCFSFDSRWVTVSTLRGTTHVFPITPYGGNIGVRTHTTPHVVNKMSRFHRSAGLTSEGRSNSPVAMSDSPVSSSFPFHNPRFAPFPHPTVVMPLAQLRQPVYMQNIGNPTPRSGRQRLTSSSEDNIALRLAACFAPARAWINSTVHLPRETGLNKAVKPVESLFIINCHGNLVQYDLEPHHANYIAKEKICDDTPIELTVTAKAQWRLQRQPASVDRPLPLPHQNLAFVLCTIPRVKRKMDGNDDDWLSQVEITTHAGPHRRLWMGPQFTFKTYTTTGTPMSLADAQPLDLNRSKPMNMPITKANAVLIESSSASSSEQSLLDIYRKNCEELGAAGEHQIKEDLADAMIESPGTRDAGGRCVLVSMKSSPAPPRRAATAPSPIAKVVNPLGTVVTVHSDDENETIVVPEEIIIYENCDETLFRPLVTAKSIKYCPNSKADGGNIMTQSLRGDTNVTVRIMDRNEIISGTNWEDPRIEDIKNNAKVIVKEGEVKDLLNQKIDKLSNQLANVKPVANESKKTKTKCNIETDCSVDDKSKRKSSKHLTERDESSKSYPKDNESRSSSERESKKSSSKIKQEKKEIDNDLIRSECDEWTYGLANPLYNVIEECGRLKSKNATEEASKYDATIELALPKVKKSRTKKGNGSVPANDDVPDAALQNISDKEPLLCEAEVSFTLPAKSLSKSKKKAKAESAIETKDTSEAALRTSNILKDLEPVGEISFPALDNKLVNPEFPALEESFFSLENLNKTEKYEDAEDCGLPLEPLDMFNVEANSKCADNANRLQNDITNKRISDDYALDDDTEDKFKTKGSLKKPRKPKTKLGVKIGTLSKEESPERNFNTETSFPDLSAEITLPAPKRSWSSIAASKPSLSERNDPWKSAKNGNNAFSTLKSYSSVTTEKLLDIDTPEECSDNKPDIITDDVLNDKTESVMDQIADVTVSYPDLLKLSDKSSDDDKNESGSSPIETTESSDEGRALGDKENKSSNSPTMASKSSAKRRVKKKKK